MPCLLYTATLCSRLLGDSNGSVEQAVSHDLPAGVCLCAVSFCYVMLAVGLRMASFALYSSPADVGAENTRLCGWTLDTFVAPCQVHAVVDGVY